MKEKELVSFVSFAVQFRKVCAVYIDVDGTNFTKLNLSLTKINTRIFLYLASTSHPSAAKS